MSRITQLHQNKLISLNGCTPYTALNPKREASKWRRTNADGAANKGRADAHSISENESKTKRRKMKSAFRIQSEKKYAILPF